MRTFLAPAALALTLACGGGSSSTTPPAPTGPSYHGPWVVYSRTTSTPAGDTTTLHALQEDGTHDVVLNTFTGLGGSWEGRSGDRFIFSEQVGQTDTSEAWRHYSIWMDGTGRKLLSGASTDWTSGTLIVGNRVILERGSTGELFTVPADGSKDPVRFSLPGKYAFPVTTVGGGVLFQQQTDTQGNDLVCYRPADGSAPAIPLYTRTATAQETFRAVIGDRVVYTTSQSIASVRLDGTDARTLTTVPRFLMFQGFAGTLAIYQNFLGPGSELWAVPVDGSGPALALDTTPDTQSFTGIHGEAFQGAGRLVYGRISTATPTLGDLYSVPLTGGTPLKLTALTEIEIPFGVRDGQAYFQITVGGFGSNGDLYRVALDGTGLPQPLLQTPNLEQFLGFLDGRLIFLRRFDDREELRSATPDGLDDRLLATAPPSLMGRPWACISQGRVYANTESAPATYVLLSVKADGTEAHTLVTDTQPIDFEDVL
ncbi:MAG TPA: hypothetical protein VJ623_10195 [Holophagaceae bacterium]|nr:hypothetical protein [Holophagaceae bacterium]